MRKSCDRAERNLRGFGGGRATEKGESRWNPNTDLPLLELSAPRERNTGGLSPEVGSFRGGSPRDLLGSASVVLEFAAK
jgi:hypothetical protein